MALVTDKVLLQTLQAQKKIDEKNRKQVDWNQNNENAIDFIKNKPLQKQPDWNQNDEKATDFIKNRPFYSTTVTFTLDDKYVFWYEHNSPDRSHFSKNFSLEGISQIEMIVDGQTYIYKKSGLIFTCGSSGYIEEKDNGETSFTFRTPPWDRLDHTDVIDHYTLKPGSSLQVIADKVIAIPEKFLSIKPGKCNENNGEIFNDYINNQASGRFSHAEGRATTASRESSHAEGGGTISSGGESHAEGSGTTASGQASHAEGHLTKAFDFDSHAEGEETSAIGRSSHAEGQSTKAFKEGSHAEGRYTIAFGKGSHAEGGFSEYRTPTPPQEIIITEINYSSETFQCTNASGANLEQDENPSGYILKKINNSSEYRFRAKIDAVSKITILDKDDFTVRLLNLNEHYMLQKISEGALGQYSHTEGFNTTAFGSYSHTEGEGTTASGDSSHAEGSGTTASNNYAHAEGYHTTASGSSSHSEGFRTTASGNGSHVEGRYNIPDTSDGTLSGTPNNKYAHIVGNGNSGDYDTGWIPKYSNAHTLDWDGNAWFAGNVKIGGTGQDDTTAKELATKEYVGTEISKISLTPGPAGPKGDTGAQGPAGKDGKDYSPTVKTLTIDPIQLENNTIYRAESLTSINFTLPSSTLNSIFEAELDLTVGTTPIQVTAPSDIDWMGDDVESGAWVPIKDKRYVLYIYWDGVHYRAISQGQKIGG